MNARFLIIATLLTTAVACDDKKETPPTSQSAAVSVVPPIMSAPPVATPSMTASAAPASSTVILTGADSNDVTLTIKDPSKDPEYTVKVKAGGALTLFLPDTGGQSWGADSPGPLGKPKEEVIPGFAKDTLGHQFKWTGLKAGKTTVTFGYRKAAPKGAPPAASTATFKLTVDAS